MKAQAVACLLFTAKTLKSNNFLFSDSSRVTLVQLNKYETDPYILQIFQSNTSVCLIISVFCKSCEPIWVNLKLF